MHRSTLAGLSAALLGGGAATAMIATAGAAPTATTAAQGGLSVSPQIMQTTARRGATGSVTVTNSTGRTLRMTVRARPWRQSSSGTVAANRRRKLRNVRVRSSRFTLANGASRAVSVTLRRVGRGRSQYGALEIVGKPTRRRRGININYRLISSLRFNPTSRRLRLGAGSARVVGRGRGRKVALQVRNRGNTVDPVTGSFSISGAGRARSGRIASQPILPGKRINLRLGSVRGLRRGSYRVSATLTQAGRNITSVSRRFRIR